MPAKRLKDIKVTIDLDEFCWGDMEDIESPNMRKILDVCSRLCVIEGVEPAETRATLRRLHYKDARNVIDMVTEALRNEANPVDETGKN